MVVPDVAKFKRLKIVGDKIFWTHNKQQLNRTILYLKKDKVESQNKKKPRGIILFAEEYNIKNKRKRNRTKTKEDKSWDNAFNNNNIQFFTIPEAP